jgi:UDP-N-acetylmuramoylalanine--D-glutamate ligase
MTTAKHHADLWASLREHTFLIVGFSQLTGLSAARLLQSRAVRYKISELRSRPEIEPLLTGLTLSGADVHCGPQRIDQLSGITRILLSPGVPRTIPLIAEATRRRIPIYSDIDFIYPFICHKPLVAITGTDGKTTTTTLTAQILGASAKVVVAGNIGVPILSTLDEILESDYVVLEVSSFMLDSPLMFRANVAAITNIAQDHVERYGSLDEYATCKFNVVSHATERDVFIKNLDDPRVAAFATARAQVRTISTVDPNADYAMEGQTFRIAGHRFHYSDCRLRGIHNAHNILIAGAIAHTLGTQPERIAEIVRRFPGVPHRFESIGRFRGVEVINDSKATTVQAVHAALSSLGSGVVLIMGGRDKGLDFSPLRMHAGKVNALIAYGEAAQRIAASLGTANTQVVWSFQDAVQQAAQACRRGDVLLLSPGCTSWDQFPSYEARGEVFQRLARLYLGGAGEDS